MKKEKTRLSEFIIKYGSLRTRVAVYYGVDLIDAGQFGRYNWMLTTALLNRLNKEGL